MGRELKERGLKFDLVLSSTAARARETIDGVREKYDFGVPIQFEPKLYLASETTLLDLVRGLDEKLQTPLIVGHNPGLELLVAHLARDDKKGLRHRVLGKFPTGALAVLELPADHWSKVEPGTGEIVELILPKELD
jgi:phosphohistidine phosphatase